jgi:hypothetical protein
MFTTNELRIMLDVGFDPVSLNSSVDKYFENELLSKQAPWLLTNAKIVLNQAISISSQQIYVQHFVQVTEKLLREVCLINASRVLETFGSVSCQSVTKTCQSVSQSQEKSSSSCFNSCCNSANCLQSSSKSYLSVRMKWGDHLLLKLTERFEMEAKKFALYQRFVPKQQLCQKRQPYSRSHET